MHAIPRNANKQEERNCEKNAITHSVDLSIQPIVNEQHVERQINNDIKAKSNTANCGKRMQTDNANFIGDANENMALVLNYAHGREGRPIAQAHMNVPDFITPARFHFARRVT